MAIVFTAKLRLPQDLIFMFIVADDVPTAWLPNAVSAVTPMSAFCVLAAVTAFPVIGMRTGLPGGVALLAISSVALRAPAVRGCG